MAPDWQKQFPTADFRLPIGLRAGSAAAFWSRWDKTGKLLEERRRWLAESLRLFAGSLPEAEPGRREALAWMQSWDAEPEPDWVLLSSDVEREPVVLAGEVVFPSTWSLPEKLGLPLSAVHAPVRGLQKALGTGIQTFLARLESGAAWERENWGMSAHQELNNHPARSLPGLMVEARLETTWLRLERQFLTRLPQTRCLLFGIRVSHYRLDEVVALPGMGERVARALRTMPEAISRYKGLDLARDTLARRAADAVMQ
jgi:hypothetical protein